MKHVNKLSIAVAMALLAGNASAALVQTYDPSDSSFATPINNGTGSSILLAVNDQKSGSANFGKTFLLDLGLGVSGLNYASFVNGTQGTNGTLSWNLSGYSAFTALAADTANLKWSVVGGSVLDGNTLSNATAISGAVAPYGVVTTVADPTVWKTNASLQGSANLIAQTTPGTNTVGGAIDAANVSLIQLAAASNSVLAPASGTGKYDYTGLLPFEGTLGTQSVGFYAVTNASIVDSTADVNSYTKLGTFSLSSGDVLTFNANSTVSSVPLPAGAWLFLSGMVGMLGLKRRNGQSGLAA